MAKRLLLTYDYSDSVTFQADRSLMMLAACLSSGVSGDMCASSLCPMLQLHFRFS
jgi:hypothetical protein